jgi:signal transduction histidine kinase
LAVVRLTIISNCAAASFPRDDERLRASNANPRAPGRGSMASRVALSGKVEQIPDISQDAEYDLAPQYWFFGSARALVGLPLLREGRVEGIFVLGRLEPGRFTERQVEIVQTFADQAVIAIENVRLFDEVQAKRRDLEEALTQQNATADVLKVISRSAFDLPTVLQTLVESAARLCEADKASIVRRVSDAFYPAEAYGFSPEFVRAVKDQPIGPTSGSAAGRALQERRTVHLPDVEADPDYSFHAKALGGYRAILAVPMLREGDPMGVLSLIRSESRPFTDRQTETAATFADQAAIAIENARLFNEVQARTEELTASLSNLRNAQDRLIQSEKLASLGQLTAGIAHEIKNPLNFVNNFSPLSRELLDELRGLLAKSPLGAATRNEADDLIATAASNLDKVVQHGRRADSIVKNMLMHAREGSGERTETNVNAMVEEALNLAYHGARAEKPGFNVTIVKELDPDAGQADIYPQEITRVLLNLISNGFYATTKRRQAASEPSYEPTLSASTCDLGDRVEIAIKDNGTGIPDSVKEKIFNPFFTTKPAGEGTGLGLSLSHDIVVKQHGGAIDVESEPGSTTFIIRLPRADPGAVLKPRGAH